MKKDLIYIGVVALFSLVAFVNGYYTGKNKAEIKTLTKTITIYKEIEKNTLEQEKNAEKIKVIYKELKSDVKDCDFVLDFDVSRCLPK